MQKSVAIVLIIAAFLAGALTDRLARWLMTPDTTSYVPGPPGGTAGGSDPGTWDMKGCMASSQRRGMTQQEADHACKAILN